MKRMLWMALMAASVSQVGCGNKKTDESAQTQSTPAAGSVAATSIPTALNGVPVATTGGPGASTSAPVGSSEREAMVPLHSLNLSNPTKPEEVVAAFLEGMRTGNAAVIEGLLSTRARQEIKAKELVIAPIGSPKAQFEIGKAEFADPRDPNTMLVSSNWIEPGTNGQDPGEYEVVWALVKEPGGWRICEMAVDTHQEGEIVQVVNFENLVEVVPEKEVPRTAALPNNQGSAVPPPLPTNVPALPANSGLGLPGNVPPPSLPSVGAPAALPPGSSGLGTVPNGGSVVPPPALPTGVGSAPGALPPLSSGNFNLPPGSGAPPLRQK